MGNVASSPHTLSLVHVQGGDAAKGHPGQGLPGPPEANAAEKRVPLRHFPVGSTCLFNRPLHPQLWLLDVNGGARATAGLQGSD